MRRILFGGLILAAALSSFDRDSQAQVWVQEIPIGGGSAVAVAPDGDIVAAGTLRAGDQDSPDMAVVKLSAITGAESWRSTIDGTASGNDHADTLAVDGTGNVVAGGRLDNGNGYDFAVVKLAGADGTELWRTAIDGTKHTEDRVTDLAIDTAGDVLAVGSTENVGQSLPTLTVIKLSGSDGSVLWRTDVPGFTFRSGLTFAPIAADTAGDVVVASSLFTPSAPQGGFSILKFSGATGAQLWHYEHVANGSSLSNFCEVRDLAIDGSDNPVAAGACDSVGEIWFAAKPSATVVKVDGTTGNQIWLTELAASEAQGVALDSQGSVLMTGQRVESDRLGFLVAKLDASTGGPQWERTIRGDHGPMNIGHDVAVDANDDVIAWGDLDNGGTTPPAAEFAALKLDGDDGTVIWRQETGGYPDQGGRARRLAIGPSGDAYAVGSLRNPSGPTSSFAVAKLDGTVGGPVRLPGDLLRLRDTKPGTRRVMLKTKSSSIAASLGGLADPTVTGASLIITNSSTSETTTIALPATGWAAVGTPPGSKGFVYADLDGDSGPCNAVRLTGGLNLKASCEAPGLGFTLGREQQGTPQVELVIGAVRQCMKFGGKVHTSEGSFRARRAPRPSACP